ncbi:twin-arginine translocation pathway signal sequence domain protein, putative [Fulvimarina pelagi HTCC2506]|uniref:Twin-arginine translocation pathway signal sequence domain protein, putative n=1 Tax=Fulvimarina pelagi HTCC2506 TaxID=314231 RepID=Q0G573_9HYPH|nr:DM13 domain-containing protein [Fulvimarina pelagi]EAU43191.1 twin-arginine translocation pathway signal sequence domain protein, putative [Fulvimarina pelagi HTCC2506]
MTRLRRSTVAVAAFAAAFFATSAFAESASGRFTGAGGHVASGTVTVVTENGRTRVVFGNDFSLDSAPDAYVAFGSARSYAEGTAFAELKSLSGGQTYSAPASIDGSDYDAVWLWCRRFSVPLGVARLR